MLRRGLAAALVVCAAFFACDSDVSAGSGGGPVAQAVSEARAAFGDGLADAERILASATTAITGGLRAGTTSPRDAATAYLAAFTFFAGSVKKHADEASAALADDLSAAMASASDDALAGALTGDGGALDRFADSMQASLDAARRRALARARRFGKALTRAGTSRQRLTVVLPPWTFADRVAPAVPSAVAPEDDAPALLAVVAARLDDGTVIVGAGGRAAPALSGKFDVRLVGAASVEFVGPSLSDIGMTVSNDGTWSAVSVLNDPTQGEAVDAGNRVVAFGVEPVVGGLGGRQPARYQHAGVIGIP